MTISGADGFWYIFRVKNLKAYMLETFDQPDTILRNPSWTVTAGVLQLAH
jgi:hypothetical protein